MKKSVKRILIILSVLLVVILTVLGFLSNYLYELALVPESDKTGVLTAPHNRPAEPASANPVTKENLDQAKLWYQETPYTTESVHSFDGLKLQAYQYKQPYETHKWAILAHGYSSEARHMIEFAKGFYDMGYHVLIPDARGHGASEGDYIGMGWHDRLDYIQWVQKVVDTDAEAEIAVFGVSMGGATVMMLSGESLPSNVKVIIEDCGYTSVWDEFSYQFQELYGAPRFPVMQLTSAVTKIRAGYSFSEADALKQVKKSKTPMMFIHGDADTFVPPEMVYEVYEAADVEKELMVVKGAKHGNAIRTAGEEYWLRVSAFIQRYIP